MKPLLLSGFGININVDGRELVIHKHQTQEKIEFYPHQIPYDNFIIDGYYGNISFEALRWLSKHGITLSMLNWNGNLLSVTLPSGPISGRLKIKQYKNYNDNLKRYDIAFKIIEAKIKKSEEFLIRLADYYKELQKDEIIEVFKKEFKNYKSVKNNVSNPKKSNNFLNLNAQLFCNTFYLIKLISIYSTINLYSQISFFYIYSIYSISSLFLLS